MDLDFAKKGVGGSNTPHAETVNTETAETLAIPPPTSTPFPTLPLSADVLMALAAVLHAKGALPLLEADVTQQTSTAAQKEVLHITTAKEKDKPQKDKMVRKDPNEDKGFSEAREDSSAYVEEDEQGKLNDLIRKKVDAERFIRELNEEIMKEQASKVKPILEPTRTERKVILREPAATSAVMTKKCHFEDKERDSKYNTKADSYTGSTFRMRGSPFTDEILGDPMSLKFRPITIEYDGTDDPEATYQDLKD